jgi:diacylglycerol kinase family enzyme
VDGQGEVADAATPEELARAVERFRAARVEVLGINGGDGTGQQVLTALSRAYGDEPLPKLLLLRGGSMNTVAHGHAIRGGPERILRSVLAGRERAAPLRTRRRDVLRVSADGAAPRLGFIFGTGVVVSFLEAYYATRRPSPGMAALLVARGLASIVVRGPFARALVRRDPLSVLADGERWPEAAYLTIAAGTTPDAGLGFRAFARCAEAAGGFHAVGVTGSLPQLARSLPRLRRGAPWPRELARDAVARSLALEGERLRFTLDGDLYAARRKVVIETGPGVEIVLP